MKKNNKLFDILSLTKSFFLAMAIASFHPLFADDDSEPVRPSIPLAEMEIFTTSDCDSDCDSHTEDTSTDASSEVTISISSTQAVDVELTIKFPDAQTREIFLDDANKAKVSLFKIKDTTDPIAISEQITIAKETLEKLVTSLTTLPSKDERLNNFQKEFSTFMDTSFSDETCTTFLEKLDSSESEDEKMRVIKEYVDPILDILTHFAELFGETHGGINFHLSHEVYA